MKKLLHGIFHTIFWGWNLAFLMVVYFGILPIIAPPLLVATISGRVPIEFAVSLVALIAVPTLCTWLGALRFSSQPLQLIRLFYGVEAPLFLLCLLRLFIFRELTPASTQILVSVGICIFAFLGDLLASNTLHRRKAVAWVQMAAHSLMLLVGLYAGAILFYYAVPLAGWLVIEFVSMRWLAGIWNAITSGWFILALWWIPVSLILFGATCSLFVMMPSAMASMYVLSGRKMVKNFAQQYGKGKAVVGAGTVLVASLTLFLSLQNQPQIKAFNLLERPVIKDSDRTALLAKSEDIRTGLLNAYLGDYRYLSSIDNSNSLKPMYRGVFGLPEAVVTTIQDSYNYLMSPFLYNGYSQDDSKKAERLYEQFFDKPLQKAEREAVNHALSSTFNQDEAKAGLLNINQQKVWLRQQNITVQERGDWADVELYEVYENKTNEVQEVFYSFSLPESAVITGIWLGDTGDLNKRFPFVVSPRGAAQKVYNSQVRRERPIDPALLEQVGPRHYRLRAFPVPVRQGVLSGVAAANRPTEMHMWLTYKVMQQPQGWALPHLGEQRNIFWNGDTKRFRNGKVSKNKLDSWVEDFIPASQPLQPQPHQVNLPGNYQLAAKPLSDKDYSLPQNQRFAIILDTSRSMGAHRQQLQDTFTWLKQRGFANNSFVDNDADLYLTATTGVTGQRLDDISKFNPDKFTFYGSVQLQEMLQQFTQLRGDTAYNGILLITDEGSYELADDKKQVPVMPAPLWMVHLGALPPAYDDAVLKAIDQSKGGVVTEIPLVLQRIATTQALGKSAVSVVDGYAWLLEKVDNPTPNTATSGQKSPEIQPFDALAARQLILGLSRDKDLNQLVNLDAIHALAKNFQIVTPYSSMIVLVNDEQRAALKAAEAASDRFNRKVESGKEQLTKPNNPLNNSSVSVPEPSAAVAVGMFGLVCFFFTKQRR